MDELSQFEMGRPTVLETTSLVDLPVLLTGVLVVLVFMLLKWALLDQKASAPAPKHSRGAVSGLAPFERPGALSEQQARLFMQLLEMARLLANKITKQHDCLTLAELGRLPAAQKNALTAAVYAHWDAAPEGGPGVSEMLRKWSAANLHRAQYRPSPLTREFWTDLRAPGGYERLTRRVRKAVDERERTAAMIHECVEKDCVHWSQGRLSGKFHLVEVEPGVTLLVTADETNQRVVEASGITRSIDDMLRQAGAALPATLELTLLPFFGRYVMDGTLKGELFPRDEQGLALERQLVTFAKAARKYDSVVRCNYSTC